MFTQSSLIRYLDQNPVVLAKKYCEQVLPTSLLYQRLEEHMLVNIRRARAPSNSDSLSAFRMRTMFGLVTKLIAVGRAHCNVNKLSYRVRTSAVLSSISL